MEEKKGPVEIDSNDTLKKAHKQAIRLLDIGDPGAAITFVDSLQAVPEWEESLKSLRGIIYADGGYALKQLDTVQNGAALFRDLKPEGDPSITYNLGNAEMDIWLLSVAQKGFPVAWEQDRGHLKAAHTNLDRVGDDEGSPSELRLQALTNAANSYDCVGRDLDALDKYDEAIGIEPSFGMAHGNRGIALRYTAPYMGEHAATVLNDAARSLDLAIENKESVLRYGGPSALHWFERERASLPKTRKSVRQNPRWKDPYLAWCHEHKLFLHVSHSCLGPGTANLDPASFRSLTSGFSEEERQRIINLLDAYNAIKQAYVTARYLAWIAAEPGPVRDHTKVITKRTSFLDSLTYARWGVRTGIGVEAFGAAVDVLDKIASFIHLYFATGRTRDVYFRSIAFENRNCKKIPHQLAAALSAPEHNRGLMALCDLSEDLRRETALSRHIDHRNAATHRFLVAHVEMTPESDDWLDHVSWDDLLRATLEQLGIARKAIFYLVRTIDIHEGQEHKGPSLPIPPSDSDLMEYD